LRKQILGKISFDELLDIIKCIRKTDEVIVSPMPGFDAGVHEIGNGMCIVIATDPCINVPLKWLGWLLIHYSASDVAVFGAKPKFCTINLLGPLETKKETFKKIMKKTCDAADELGITIITGHTGRYKGLTTILGTCTSYGIVKKERLITPAGAKPGDYILVTKSLGLETLTNFALKRKSLATDLFGSKRVINLAKQIKKQTCVEAFTFLT
jgi:hydrogenase maturation factor